MPKPSECLLLGASDEASSKQGLNSTLMVYLINKVRKLPDLFELELSIQDDQIAVKRVGLGDSVFADHGWGIDHGIYRWADWL